MCTEPTYLNNGLLVGCRLCWQCKSNHVNDYVGRCIAEQQNSSLVLAVTLTYSDHSEFASHASTLVYKDFQDFMKRLRKVYDVRYIVAGEYGTKRARAHWHAVLFFKGKRVPSVISSSAYFDRQQRLNNGDEITLERNIDWPFWPHGYSFFQKSEFQGFRYLLKYIQKDGSQRSSTSHFALSKKPPLGDHFFKELAAEYVDQGLGPKSFHYKIPNVVDGNSVLREFYMRGKTRENFVQYFRDIWEHQRPDQPLPFTHFLSDLDQKQIDDDLKEYDDDRSLAHSIASKNAMPKYGDSFLSIPWGWPSSAEYQTCTSVSGTVVLKSGLLRHVRAYSWEDLSLTILERKNQWHVINPAHVKRMLQRVTQKEMVPMGQQLRPKTLPLRHIVGAKKS